jgi:hypothetical protein
LTKLQGKKFLYVVIIIALAAVLLLGATFYLFYFQLSSLVPDNGDNGDNGTDNEFEQSLPVRFTVSDQWAGGASSSVTMTVYEWVSNTEAGEQFDTGTTDSNGIWTSNKAMKSGDKYFMKITSSNAWIYYEFTVPVATSTGQVYHYQSLDFYDDCAVAITNDYSNGTAISDGGTFNQTEASDDYPTFTILLRNTDSGDSGLVEYWDPIKSGGIQREVVFYFKVSGNQYEQVIVQNVDLIYQSASARYYGMSLDYEHFVKDKKPDGTYNTYAGGDLDGIYTINVQFDVSGMTANSDGPEVAFYLYHHDNLENFETYGTDLSDAVELQSTDYDFEIDA